MTLDVRAIADGYKAEYETYKSLVELAEGKLSQALAGQRVKGLVDGRPKTVASFVRKAIRKNRENPVKYADPLQAISDKAGIRVVVAHLEDAERAKDIAAAIFDVIDVENTATRLKPNELGYLGWHIQARMKSVELSSEELQFEGLQFEIQVHTQAQHAWSEVSHPIVYKPFGAEPEPEIASRIYRAVALVSLFDEEVATIRNVVKRSPDYVPAQMLAALDREFVPWVAEPTDDATSLDVLAAMLPCYQKQELDDFDAMMKTYVQQNRERFNAIFGEYRPVAEDYVLLFQPEVLAISERLTKAKAQLREAWVAANLPFDVLQEVASALGSSY